jgi:hypothetical protein
MTKRKAFRVPGVWRQKSHCVGGREELVPDVRFAR